jgi:hypothetical protein
MNPGIKTCTERVSRLFERACQQQPEFFPETRFQPRHAEHLLAAGFGYDDAHAYRAASDARTELCQGYPLSRLCEYRLSKPSFCLNHIHSIHDQLHLCCATVGHRRGKPVSTSISQDARKHAVVHWKERPKRFSL